MNKAGVCASTLDILLDSATGLSPYSRWRFLDAPGACTDQFGITKDNLSYRLLASETMRLLMTIESDPLQNHSQATRGPPEAP
jgi:hypothetical protein